MGGFNNNSNISFATSRNMQRKCSARASLFLASQECPGSGRMHWSFSAGCFQHQKTRTSALFFTPPETELQDGPDMGDSQSPVDTSLGGPGGQNFKGEHFSHNGCKMLQAYFSLGPYSNQPCSKAEHKLRHIKKHAAQVQCTRLTLFGFTGVSRLRPNALEFLGRMLPASEDKNICAVLHSKVLLQCKRTSGMSRRGRFDTCGHGRHGCGLHTQS